MSKATYWQRGESLDYKNTGSATISANTIVELSERIGIAGTDIKVGAIGDLHMCGVFEIEKTGAAAIDMGATVYFDGTGITGSADNGESGSDKVVYTKAGYAANAAAAADASIYVSIG